MSFALESRVDFSRQLATQGLAIDSTKTNDPAALKAVAQQFESLFMNMMMKSMRSANRSLSEGNYFNSFETKMYEDMLDEKLSGKLSTHGGLGIADLLMRQFAPDDLRPNYDIKLGQKREAALSAPQRRAVFDQPRQFVESLLPEAQTAAHKLNTRPEFIVAQAALETGWGQHVMHTGNGANSHNLFGIKADAHWQGKTIGIESLEIEQGVARQITSQFKVYPDYEAAFKDYANLIGEHDRYQSVLGSQDIKAFTAGLAEGGYATDPEYGAKIERVLGELQGSHLALRDH